MIEVFDYQGPLRSDDFMGKIEIEIASMPVGESVDKVRVLSVCLWYQVWPMLIYIAHSGTASRRRSQGDALQAKCISSTCSHTEGFF